MSSVVEAYVENYDLASLEEMLREKLAILEGRKEVTGASTGGGTSYTAVQLMDIEDHIAVLQEAVRVKRFYEGVVSRYGGDDGVREVRFDGGVSKF